MKPTVHGGVCQQQKRVSLGNICTSKSPRVPGLPREMGGFHPVRCHPAIQLRVEIFAYACTHMLAAGPEGYEVSRRVCEPSKAPNVLADRSHAQGRGAA